MLQNTFGILIVTIRRHFCHTMSSSESSRSSSPAEFPIAKKKTKTRTKTSSSSKGVPRNEGLDPSWPFAVPAGYNLCGANPDDEVDENFDWDTLKSNPNLELCLIRVPHNVRGLEWTHVRRHVNSH